MNWESLDGPLDRIRRRMSGRMAHSRGWFELVILLDWVLSGRWSVVSGQWSEWTEGPKGSLGVLSRSGDAAGFGDSRN